MATATTMVSRAGLVLLLSCLASCATSDRAHPDDALPEIVAADGDRIVFAVAESVLAIPGAQRLNLLT